MPRDAALPGSDRAPDLLTLRDDVREVDIGAFGSEHGSLQRVRFSIDLALAESGAEVDDEVDGIVSYDRLVEAINNSLAEQRYALLETLAERIAARVLVPPQARSARVRIEKLDLGPYALGVDITRRRQDLSAAELQDDRAGPVLITPMTDLPGAEALAAMLQDDLARGVCRVLVPFPLPDRPCLAQGGIHQARLDLLSQDQAAWLIDARHPRCRVAASRAEIDALIKAGDCPVWAPSRMILRRAADGEALRADAACQADWLAQTIGNGSLSEPWPVKADQ